MKSPVHFVAALTLMMCACAQNDPQDARATMNDKLDKVEDKMQEANREADTRQEWVTERNDILKELRDLRTRIDDQLARHTERLAAKDLKAADRREHEAMKTEYDKEKAIVEGLIHHVEGATDATWTTVKADTRKGADDVKAWWDRMRENTDRKTDADNDNDGH